MRVTLILYEFSNFFFPTSIRENSWSTPVPIPLKVKGKVSKEISRSTDEVLILKKAEG